MRLVAVVLFLVALAALAQSRTVTLDAAGYRATSTVLDVLPDGGCAVRWCGEVPDSDGTPQRACTELVELRTSTNRNRCDALVSAGVPRVLRELRFAVDGGSP